jgi:Flp pilus assembly protein TadD, contains TPR repeats
MFKVLNSKFIVSLLFVCSVLIFAQNGEAQNRRNEKRARDLSAEGDKQFRQKNYRVAIDSYAQAIALSPKVAYPRFWKGLAHAYLNEPEMALPEFDAALANGYNKPLDVYATRWRIHYQRKDYEKALADVQSGLLLDPSNQDFLLAQGDIAYSNGSFQVALDAYQKYLVKNQNNAEVYFNIAKSHQALGNFIEQTAAAENAIRKGTRSLADAHIIVGDGYTGQLRFTEAVEAYKRAVLARPDAYQPYQRLAEGYRALAKFDDAIETSRKALRLFPNDGLIYSDISWYYSLADRHQDAVDAAQAGIRYSPESQMAYTNLCRAYNDLKRHDLAIAACNNALRIKAEDGESLFYLARATRALGRSAEASRLTKRAVAGLEGFVAGNPTYSDGYYLLGGAYYDDGQKDKALTAYERSLQLSPNFVKALYNVGIVYLIDGKKDRASNYQKRLEQLSPKYAKMLLDEINAS